MHTALPNLKLKLLKTLKTLKKICINQNLPGPGIFFKTSLSIILILERAFKRYNIQK